MNTGERILNVRKNAGLSQEQFGELFGVSRQSVSKWESNQSLPETTTIIKIAKTFDVSADYLLCISTDNDNTQKSFEIITADKMRFNLGCILVFTGVILMSVSFITSHNSLRFWGNPIRMIMNGFISEKLYYTILLAIILSGFYICRSTVIKRSKH